MAVTTKQRIDLMIQQIPQSAINVLARALLDDMKAAEAEEAASTDITETINENKERS
jgi:hypothetical protein